ncbi:MAG: aminoacyl-tRNA deacylase [Rhodospirillales bacterium]
MAIAITLEQYLADSDIDYETLTHPRAVSSSQTAEVSHIPGSRLAKAVLLKEGKDSYLLAVLPASHHIRLDQLREWLGRPVALATEEEIEALFSDCDLGAVPPIGNAYGIDVVVDDSLVGDDDIYFEAGDHATLVRVAGTTFEKLMGSARQGQFSRNP